MACSVAGGLVSCHLKVPWIGETQLDDEGSDRGLISQGGYMYM